MTNTIKIAVKVHWHSRERERERESKKKIASNGFHVIAVAEVVKAKVAK
jgi:hypothetical protein